MRREERRQLEETPFAAAAADTSATVFECGLCGLRFTHGEQACGSCLIGASCALVKCPRCGFQFPRPSRLLRLVERALGGTP